MLVGQGWNQTQDPSIGSKNHYYQAKQPVWISVHHNQQKSLEIELAYEAKFKVNKQNIKLTYIVIKLSPHLYEKLESCDANRNCLATIAYHQPMHNNNSNI